MKHLENLITVYNEAGEYRPQLVEPLNPAEVTGQKLYELEGWFRSINYVWNTDWIVRQILGDDAYVEWLPDDQFRIHKR